MTVLLETKNTGEFPRSRPFIDVLSRRKKIKKDASFSSIFSFEKCRGQRRTCVHRHGATLVKKSKVATRSKRLKKKIGGAMEWMDGHRGIIDRVSVLARDHRETRILNDDGGGRGRKF